MEVKVVDRYLTVAAVRDSDTNNGTNGTNGTQDATGMAMPARLCSLRVLLLLEDMGPTGDPDDDGGDEKVRISAPDAISIQTNPVQSSQTQNIIGENPPSTAVKRR